MLPPPSNALLRKRVMVAIALLIAVAGAALFIQKNRADGPTTQPAAKTAELSQEETDVLSAGLAAHTEGKLDEAEAQYNKLLEINDKNSFAYYNLGVVAQSNGKTDEAVSKYRKALELSPNYPPALFNLAIILTRNAQGRDEAVELYRKVVELEPENAGAMMNLGILLANRGETKEAEDLLSKALTIDPTLAQKEGDAPADEGAPSPEGAPKP